MSRFEMLCPEYLRMSPSEAAEEYMRDLNDVSAEQLEYLEDLNGTLADSLRGEQEYSEPPGEAEQREHVADCFEAIHAELVKALQRRGRRPMTFGPQVERVEFGPGIQRVELGPQIERVDTAPRSVTTKVTASANAYEETEVGEVASCQAKKAPRKQVPVVAEPEPPPRRRKKRSAPAPKPAPEPEPVWRPCREQCRGRFSCDWHCDSLVAVTGTGFDTSNTEIGYNAAQWLNALEGVTVGSIVGWEALADTAPAAMSAGSKAFGGLAIAGGAIDLLISLRRLGNTSTRIHNLRQIVNDHTDVDVGGIEGRVAAYALKKKWRKLRRTLVAISLASVAIASGIVGLAVAGPVGWGIALGLAILGVFGAAGVLAFRYYRYRKKEARRKRRVEQYADHILDCATRGEQNAAARMLPEARRWGPERRGQHRDTLIDKLLELDVSERFLMASGLVGLFFEDWLRITREAKQAKEDGEGKGYQPVEPAGWTTMSAIAVKPHKIAAALGKAMDQAEQEGDDGPVRECYRTYVDKVFGKLKSW